MSPVSRFALAMLTAVLLAAPVAVLAEYADLGSWPTTGLGLIAVLLATLVDREGFYGPREHR